MDLSKASFILIGADGKPATTTLAELKTALDALDTPIVEQPPVVVTDPPVVVPPVTTKPDATVLTPETPDYNAITGIITFKSSGGDGTPVEFSAPGITGWTSKVSHSVGEMQKDPKSVTITARQSGKQTAPLVFDLRKGAITTPVTEPPVITKPGTGTVVDRPTSNPPVVQVDAHFIANTPRS